MSIRKRTWTNAKGETKEAWIVDYIDQHGKEHIKTFARKKDADAYHIKVRTEVREGRHTADSASVTVAEAGKHWIRVCEGNNLERATLGEYQRHLDMHIVPYLGEVKLSRLTAPMVSEFRTKLREGTPAPGQETGEARSPAMVKKIMGSLSSLLADAQEVGYVAQNVVRSLTNRKKKKTKAEQRRKLKVGADIPTPEEVKAIIAKLELESRWRPLLLTALFSGLRASELRGLRWDDVDLVKGEIHVRQRADRYNEIDAPKSEAGERTVPLPPTMVKILREWKLKCPRRDTGQKDQDGKPIKELHYVFPNGAGHVENHGNIVNRGLTPIQIAAGVCTIVKDADGKIVLDDEGEPVKEAKYTGLHALRHFYASWCINRKVDGGLELPAKVVQERLGHSSITMTLDTYGHLFPRGDDADELAAAEQIFFVPDKTPTKIAFSK
jgi:integrase